MLDSPVKSPLLNPHGQDFLLLNSPVESPLLSSKSMDPKTSLLDSLCQDLYTGDRLRKLRYSLLEFLLWSPWSLAYAHYHALLSLHRSFADTLSVGIPLRRGYHCVALRPMSYRPGSSIQWNLNIYSEPPLIPEHFHLSVLALLSQQTLIATISLLLQPHLGSGLLHRLQY